MSLTGDANIGALISEAINGSSRRKIVIEYDGDEFKYTARIVVPGSRCVAKHKSSDLAEALYQARLKFDAWLKS